MTPAARVAAAIAVLDDWRSGTTPMDRLLAAWGRANRYAGSGDRRAISDLVYDALRRMRSAAWVAGAGDDASGRQILHGLALLQGRDPAEVFTGARHSPPPLNAGELAARRPLAEAPHAIRFDYPDWLSADFAGLPEPLLATLTARAPLDLRVNGLRADPSSAEAALAEDGIEVAPIADVPLGLRVLSGQRKVQTSRAYRDGLVEVQDAASQIAAAAAAAAQGEMVLDLCAGGGGKALAMAADMQNRGRLIAHDISPDRIGPLAARASRAGAAIEVMSSDELVALQGSCDLVLIDAPCSGAGTWRRNPDAKWRLTPERLAALARTQSAVLEQGAGLVRTGGRIVYVTCSLLERENSAVIDGFLARSPGWGLSWSRHLMPNDPGDGMFIACLRGG